MKVNLLRFVARKNGKTAFYLVAVNANKSFEMAKCEARNLINEDLKQDPNFRFQFLVSPGNIVALEVEKDINESCKIINKKVI